MIFQRLRAMHATITHLSRLTVKQTPDFATQRAIVAGIAQLRRDYDALNDEAVAERRREYAERPYTLYQPLAAHGATGGDIQ